MENNGFQRIKNMNKQTERNFDNLTFNEEENQINASINNLLKTIEYHIEHSSYPGQTRQKCLEKIQSLVNRILPKQERPLGILKGKAQYKIKDDFEITDNELLSL